MNLKILKQKNFFFKLENFYVIKNIRNYTYQNCNFLPHAIIKLISAFFPPFPPFRMAHQRPQLLIISISLLYWFRHTGECWKFDGGGPGVLGPGTNNPPALNTPTFIATYTHLRAPRSASASAAAVAARGPPPAVPPPSGNGGVMAGGSFSALLNGQQQDILYACPLNSMCQCAGLPNETSTLIEINCNEVALYKFPGE